jgi:hypothetical protein
MLTRRALLGAGVLLLAGCGPPKEPEVKASDVWEDQLGASRDALAAYPDGPATARLRKAAESRVKRLAAVAPSGGSVQRAVSPSLDAALDAERTALQRHVEGVGLLKDTASRELLSGLVAETAQAQSELLELLKRRPLETAFPGQPPNPR